MDQREDEEVQRLVFVTRGGKGCRGLLIRETHREARNTLLGRALKVFGSHIVLVDCVGWAQLVQ